MLPARRYTGVASAPFFGPTLLWLRRLGIGAKNNPRLRSLTRQEIHNALAKFEKQSGVSIQHLGGIVIDEVARFVSHIRAPRQS